jgi:hypothetical protein
MARPGAKSGAPTEGAERQVSQLQIRRLFYEAIGKQIGGTNSSAMGADQAKSSSASGAVRTGSSSGK